MGPRAGRVQAQQHDMMAQPKTSPKPLEPRRMPGGFSGSKLRMAVPLDERQPAKSKPTMKGGVLPGSAPPGGCKRYPIQRVFTPDLDAVGLTVAAMVGGNNTRGGSSGGQGNRPGRRNSLPRVSSVLLELEDEQDPEPDPHAEQDKEYADMRSLSELHHQELSVMKKEILGLRADLETQLQRRRATAGRPATAPGEGA